MSKSAHKLKTPATCAGVKFFFVSDSAERPLKIFQHADKIFQAVDKFTALIYLRRQQNFLPPACKQVEVIGAFMLLAVNFNAVIFGGNVPIGRDFM